MCRLREGAIAEEAGSAPGRVSPGRIAAQACATPPGTSRSPAPRGRASAGCACDHHAAAVSRARCAPPCRARPERWSEAHGHDVARGEGIAPDCAVSRPRPETLSSSSAARRARSRRSPEGAVPVVVRARRTCPGGTTERSAPARGGRRRRCRRVISPGRSSARPPSPPPGEAPGRAERGARPAASGAADPAPRHAPRSATARWGPRRGRYARTAPASPARGMRARSAAAAGRATVRGRCAVPCAARARSRGRPSGRRPWAAVPPRPAPASTSTARRRAARPAGSSGCAREARQQQHAK